MKDIYFKCESQNLESNHFFNTLVFNDLYSAHFSLILSTAFVVKWLAC